jgi:hypothetical protein
MTTTPDRKLKNSHALSSFHVLARMCINVDINNDKTLQITKKRNNRRKKSTVPKREQEMKWKVPVAPNREMRLG